jgi:hypothetical protein
MLITKTLPVLIVGGTLNYYRSKGVVCNVGDKINLPVEMQQYHKLVKLKDATKENFNIYLNNIKEQSASV